MFSKKWLLEAVPHLIPSGAELLVPACCGGVAVFILSHPWVGLGVRMTAGPGRIPAGHFSYGSAQGDLLDTDGCPHPQVIPLVVQA